MKLTGCLTFAFVLGIEVGWTRPDANHITCALESVNTAGKLTEREKVMGNDVVQNPTPWLATQYDEGNTWFQVEITDNFNSNWKHVVHSEDSEIQLYSTNNAAYLGETCEDRNYIAYGLVAGDVIRWKPWRSDSVISVLGSAGPGTRFYFMQWTQDGLVEAPPTYPPSPSPTTTVTTAAPTLTGETGAPTITQGGIDGGIKDKDGDIIFGVVVALLTVAYLSFLWVTIEPIKTLKSYKA